MNDSFTRYIISRCRTILLKIEFSLLVLTLGFMVIFSVLQIILRNFFDSGIIWGDALLRVVVLWTAMIGATTATRQNSHISINILSHYFSDSHFSNIINILIQLVAATICGLIAYYSIAFVKMEYQDGLIAFAKMPVWICELIIPIAFSVMCLRYSLTAVHLSAFSTNKPGTL